jgi:Zn-dependent peptidase ImmA (M78 family)
LIQLSLRHKTDDHFWFSFFHEAVHILKHGKRNLYLDDTNSGNTDLEEEANKIAAEILLPDSQYQNFCDRTRSFTESSIKQFARKAGIAPGIVLGRLQHDGYVAYRSILNTSLKKHFKLRKK